ncbi:MAG TPA: ATP-binding protein [Mycobacteriales bacterium]|nr:ATP-binding protein [Mycobacteriales bacterium]
MGELRLPPAAESVPAARRFARNQLRDSSCDTETAALLVSEVVTNAVLHGRSAEFLDVEDRGASAYVSVSDASPMPPRVHNFAVESATGRGLRLVDQLAQRWGVDAAASGKGKVVWFEVGEPSAAAWESFADTLLAEGAPGDL